MRVLCVGGGPAGLFFALLMKQLDPTHEVVVYERNERGSTFGWGVVFSDGTLDVLRKAEPRVTQQITETLAHWDDIEVHFKNEVIRSSGHGFCGIARQRLLDILEDRAREVGVQIHYKHPIENIAQAMETADLVVAADGIFSRTREQFAAEFQPEIELRKCRYTWLGTHKLFEAFTFIFKETPHGWFQAHCYRFDQETSTFIVECPEETWRKAGIDRMSKEEGIRFCEELFRDHLDGHSLMSNAAHLVGSAAWINFPRVINTHWHYKNLVLLGDASATAHFSIGSGTKLAMESAIALSRVVNEESDLNRALEMYEAERRVEVVKLQNAARNSTEWFETVADRAHLDPQQFAYSLLTRSQRISHENLRRRDAEYIAEYERAFARQATNGKVTDAVPPMFVPLQIGDLTLSNRVAVSPMATYSAVEGMPNDFHLVHLGARALGGASLVFTEMTCVSPEGRITPGCAGIWNKDQAAAWKRIVDFVHTSSQAKIALQLGHSGRKGSTKVGWEGMDEPLDDGNWTVLAPSPIRYKPNNQIPREISRKEMDEVRENFVASAKFGLDAGFDWLELHCAHGYLLSSFLSPVTNHRRDDYGGPLENRLRFPIEVFSAVRAAWPKGKPVSVRISAVDWVDGGNTVEDAVEIARAFSAAGADLIDVSTGQVTPDEKPIYGRMWQTPFSERVRIDARVKTMAVGNIFEPDHVNSIIAAGRADLCLLARPHLADPQWTLRAAAEVGYTDQWWPKQYLSGKRQLEVNIQRAKTRP